MAYVELVRSFVERSISAAEFERCSLTRFKNEPAGMDSRLFDTLNGLFRDVERYSPDCRAEWEGPFIITEATLRQRATEALSRLQTS